MTQVRFAFAIGLAAAVLSAGPAQDTPKKAEPKKAEPARLTTEKLGAMLTDMGFEPKSQDKQYYTVKVSVPDWESTVWLWVVSDREVRLFAGIGLWAGFEDAPAGAWLKLLEANDALRPAAFALEAKRQRLTLSRPVPNADLTPAKLRKELTGFAELVKTNRDVWKATNFLPEVTPEARKVLDRMAGTWKLTSFVARGKAADAAEVARLTVTIEKDTIRALKDGKEVTLDATIRLDVRGGKNLIDLHTAGGELDQGIFRAEGDTLSICAGAGGGRPTAVAATEKTTLMVLKRDKK